MFSTNIERAIKNLIAKEGYLTYEIDKFSIATNGSNYVGKLYEVDVTGKTKDGDQTSNLFVKVNNGGGTGSTKSILINNLYQIELLAYKELTVTLADMQEDANVPLRERYKLVKSYEDSSTEAIILENIARKGFRTNDRMEVVTLEFAEMSIRQLAKLHGLSFALEKKRPDYFNTMFKDLKYPLLYWDDLSKFVKSMINITINYIDDNVKSRVENKYLKLADKYAQFFEDKGSRRCICHGDYRADNIMITLNNGKITDSAVVDYQFLHYGCPAMDIIYFLYMSADQKFRNAHMSHLKDLYHETLRIFLKYFDLDVDSVYSRETLEQDFREKLDYGLIVGFVCLPLSLAKEDDVPDFAGDSSEMSFRVSDAFKDRQRGMIEEFTKWRYM